MAETAASSPIRPLTMMKGRSTKPLRLSNPSAANELKAGMESSEMTRSQLCPSSAASMTAAVSTRSQVRSYPPLRNILTRSRASSSESSTSKSLSGAPIYLQAPYALRRPGPEPLRRRHDSLCNTQHGKLLFYCYPGVEATRCQRAKHPEITHLGYTPVSLAEL